MAATLLADGGRGPGRWAWYGLAAVVAGSRIHTRSHHASDVLAGAALGLVLGRVAKQAWPLPRPGTEQGPTTGG
jgi:undecaprenyl-diphosphatase